MVESKLVVNIKFLGNIENFSISKKYVYHADRESEYEDTINFSPNQIEICCNRSKPIKPEEYLYTIKSRIYRECLSSCLFAYYKFGKFNITGIQLDDYVVPKYNQKFECDSDYHLNDSILEFLFDYREDKVYLPLMHLTEALNNSNYKLEHSWKSFNAIYNLISKTNSDKDNFLKIFKVMKDNEATFKSIFDEAVSLITYKDGINTGKAIKFMCKNNSKQLSKIESFRNIFGIDKIQDKNLARIFKDIYNNIYSKNKSDYESNHSSGSYNYGDDTKNYAKVIKELDEIVKKGKQSETDYLRFLLDYIFYLRNKSMHGIFQSPSFLFENAHSLELIKYADLMLMLNFSLLKNDIYSLVEKSSKS